MTIPLIWAQIFCGIVFFVILPLHIWLDIRDFKKRKHDAKRATQELIEMAKGDGPQADAARKTLWVFYG